MQCEDGQDVRELRNAIEVALFRGSTYVLQPRDLPPEILMQKNPHQPNNLEQPDYDLAPDLPAPSNLLAANQHVGVRPSGSFAAKIHPKESGFSPTLSNPRAIARLPHGYWV